MANYTTTTPDWAVSNQSAVMSGIEGIKDTTVGISILRLHRANSSLNVA